MPPFSPAANGLLPNSMNEFCPEKPCHASLVTHGGSMRPVDRAVPVQVVWPLLGLIVHELGELLLPGPDLIEWPVQSAFEQYTAPGTRRFARSEEHTSELQSRRDLVCRLLLEKKKNTNIHN